MSLWLCPSRPLGTILAFPVGSRTPGKLRNGHKPAGVIASLLLGWLALGLSVVWGYQLARRVFNERDGFSLFPVSLALALVTLLLSGCYLRLWLEPKSISLATTCLLTTAIWLVKRRSELSSVTWDRMSLASWMFLGLGVPAVAGYALFELTTGMVIDGDFFVHIGSIGLFEEGHYPPLMFFLGLPTGGHYGRQMLIAQVSRLSGVQFLTVDWVLTGCLSVLTFALLFFLLKGVTSSENQAMLATGMAFFAANTGSRIGLVDTLGNHNPMAYFMLTIVTWSVLRALKVGGWSIMASAAILGASATVYETHFGLVGLTMPLMILVAPSGARRLTTLRVTGIGLLALVVAATAGGAFTDLVSREPSDIGQAQRQQVSVKLPKDDLFMLRGDNTRPSRPFEGKMRPWKADFSPTQSYQFALGSRIRDLFWYPTWLAPFACLLCLLRRHQVGLWFGGLAFFAWLVPSLTDFGFYEGEALRWLFVTAVAGSITFGLAVGMIWEKFHSRWWSHLGLMLVLWFASAGLIRSVPDMYWALKNPGEPLPIGRPGVVAEVGLIPKPFSLLSHHYGLTHDDFQAADWIKENTPRHARILADDDGESANYRSVMIGLEGRLPAGYLPQVIDLTEPSGYRRRLQIDEFWKTGDSRLLAGLEVDWLLIHSSKHNIEFGQSEKDPVKLEKVIGDIKIYSNGSHKPEYRVDEVQVKQAHLERRSDRQWSLIIKGSHSAERPLEWLTVAFTNSDGKIVGGPQWRPIAAWPSGTVRELSLDIISPYEPGLYRMKLWGGRAEGHEAEVDLPGVEVLREPFEVLNR